MNTHRIRAAPIALVLILAACGDSPTEPETTTPPVAASVEVVSPLGQIIAVGSRTQLDAEARSAEGSVVQTEFTWSSSEPSVASVSAAGLVTGVSPGRAILSATAGAARGNLEIVVAASDLVALGDLLGDPLPERLFATLDATRAQGLQQAWATCGEGLDAGNLTEVQGCVADARSHLASVEAPQGPVASILGLFADWIERHLNID